MFYSGKQIGNYTLVKILGQGSFGEVWLATRQTKFITTKVAIKLPNSEQIDSEAIKQEAILWEQASGHPNVLPIIEADEYEGQILIVSEYAADGTLGDLLSKRGFLPVKKAIEISIGILNGLEFLHSRQIIHRDIKPANILLQGNIPRLTDFGLSRAISGNSLSMSISVNGTPYYMSPEAFNRKRNRQTDIWSFGVVLYKMLTGKMPFQGNDVAEIYASVFTKEAAPMSAHIPLAVQEIVFKCLKKNPLERYQDVVEIREDLVNCQGILSAEKAQPKYLDDVSQDKFKIETAESALAFQTDENLEVENTKQNSFSLPRKKRGYFKYLAAACLLFLSVFASGFYIISKLTPVPFRQGDKFGYAKWSKDMVIGAKYDRAFPFSENFALVANGKTNVDKSFTGKYGFIDKSGREIIPIQYDYAESFSDGLAKVGKLDNSSNKMFYGFINSRGDEMIPLIYEDARSFSDSLAVVKWQGKWGAINDKGTPQIPLKYESLAEFSEDLAAFQMNDKFGFINKSGEEIIPAIYDFAGKYADGNAPVKKDGKAFFIDKKGKEIFSFKYDAASNFSEGLAFVKQNGKSGFIIKDGTEAIHFQYENDFSEFSEGLAGVRQNGKFGFIDKGGRIAVSFKYSSAEKLKGNVALVRTEDGTEFYVGYDGTEFYQP
jgi:serine/threonine protein kinase